MHKRLVLTAALAVGIGAGAEAQDSPCQVLWHPIIQLTESTYSSYEPKIALSGDDTVHVTWWENYHQHRIPYLRSVTGGETWEPVRELAVNTNFYPYNFSSQQIATDGNNVYLFAGREPHAAGPPAWTPRQMVMSKSTDRGTSWVTQRIPGDSVIWLQSVTTHRDTITVIYDRYYGDAMPVQIRLRYSTNGGQTWALSPDTTLDGWATTAYTAGTLHIANFDPLAWRYVYSRSSDFGHTYDHTLILTEPEGIALDNTFASDPITGTLLINWRDARYGCFAFWGCSIIERESYDNGSTWEPEVVLTDEPRGINSHIASHNDRAACLWYHMRGSVDAEVRGKIRIGRGSAWSEVIVKPDPAYLASDAPLNVAVSSKALHVVWVQMVKPNPDDRFAVFYRTGEFIQGSPNQIGYRSGSWNLVSHPLRSSSPVSLPSLYRYDGNYIRTQTMEEGRGYWAKPETDTVNYEGTPLTSLDIPLKRGWNIVGSISCPVLTGAVSTEPEGILTSPFFDYRNGQYEIADRIEPGRAYWVRAGEAGTLRLSSDLAEQDRARAAAGHRSITQGPEGDTLPPLPPDGDANIEHRTSDIPQSFSLEQNYPNPFNPVTEIRFGIRDAGYVTLKVYDVLGREVTRLVEGDKEPGYYEVRWDARDLPGGVYYVRMRAGGEFTETRAAVVMK